MKEKFKLILFTIAIICLLIECKDSNTGSKDGFFKRYSLHGMMYDKEIIMQPIGLFAIDSNLVIISRGVNDGFGQIFNLNNNLEKVGEFGKIGNGPNEFIFPEPTFVGNNYFYIQNTNASEIAKWGISTEESQIQIHEISRLRFKHNYFSGIGAESRKINPIGDEYFVGLICDPENGYFSFYNFEMEFIKSFGKPPVFEPKMSAFSYMRRLSGNIAANGNSFVFSAMNIPYLAYYSLEKGDTVPVLKWEDTYGEISYIAENDMFNFTDKSIGINMGVQNKDKYIYVLNIEMPWNQIDFAFAEKSLAKSILVYNHKGKHVARLDIDPGLYFFFVSEDEKTIYGITLNPDYMVVKYDIPAFN